MTAAVRAAIARICGPVADVMPLGGGDLSSVYDVRLAEGHRVIAKVGAVVEAEADMLRAIAASGCPCPAVIGTGPDLLVMQVLPSGGRPGRAEWTAFGAALGRLHDRRGEGYGWPANHAFGPVGIDNRGAADWPEFWAERRLLAGLEALPRDLARRLEALAGRLPDLLPKAPPLALLHGDLWSGNVLWGPEGFGGVIDPACYYGDAEVDLAMLQLFGHIGDGFREGYGPEAPDEAARRPVYQLWPALVHLRLFGSGYRPMVENLLKTLAI